MSDTVNVYSMNAKRNVEMHMQFSLVLVLNQFGLKKTCQVTFQPEAEVRVKSKSLSPSV